MKYIFTLIVALACLSGCKKERNPYQSEYDISLQKWNAYKASVNNSYIYTRISGSVFGPSSSTQIAVENGVITMRWYTLYTLINNQVTIVKTWVENQASLNSHTEGAPAVTIDEIYAIAKRDWLSVDKNKNDIYFETDAKGLLKSCGFVPKGCQDDCFTGADIKEIQSLK